MNLKITDFAEIALGHTFRGAIEEGINGNYRVIQAKNINSNRDLNADLISIHLDSSRTKGVVKNNDVLLSNRGSFKSAVYYGNSKNLIASSSLYVLKIKNNKVLPEYLSIYLNSSLGQKSLLECNRGAFIKSLPKSNLVDLTIPVPTLEKQERIIKIHDNYSNRERLYVRRAELQKNIADGAISNLITS